MKSLEAIRSNCLLAGVFATIIFISGCNSNPTVSSSGIPSGTPPVGTGTPSSLPSSSPVPGTIPGGQTSQTSTGSNSSQGSSSGTQDNGKASSTRAGGGQQGEKTDDQILAEALDEFGKRGQTAAESNDGDSQGSGQIPAEASVGDSITDEEKTAELDRRLGDKFAKFDDLILGEREAGSREGNSGGSIGDGDGVGNGEGEPLQTASVEPPMPSPSHGGIQSKLPGNSVSHKPPADVGEGQDDDIIARQLREAAMKEQDPELRAKLWDEYRKYKKSS